MTYKMKPKDTSINKRINYLENKVQRLQNTAWVICIVASIFGIGSSFGYVAFSSANGKLKNLEENIASVDKAVVKTMKMREQETIHNLQTASRKIFNRFAQWGPAVSQEKAEKDVIFTGQSGRSEVFYCPTGHYVIGMQVIDHNNSQSCESCINGVRFICRPINY